MSWRKWVVGLVVLGVLGGIILPIYSLVQECGPSRDRRSEAAAQGLRNSIKQFHLQYGSFSYLGPDVTAKGELQLSSDGPTLAILLGLNEERNPRKIAFGEWREAGKTRKNGIVYSANGEMWGLVDQWGNRFRMVIAL